jgi:hypothetical protein
MGKNSTPHLQNYEKYGIGSFAFIVLTIIEPSMLVAWEQLAIDLMKPHTAIYGWLVVYWFQMDRGEHCKN